MRQKSRYSDHEQPKNQGPTGISAPGVVYGRPSILLLNTLNWEFTVDSPDKVWVTDITYIRTWQGWLYLAVVLDLYARKVVGWAMKPAIAKELVLGAPLMAAWRRKPTQKFVVHSDKPVNTTVTIGGGLPAPTI